MGNHGIKGMARKLIGGFLALLMCLCAMTSCNIAMSKNGEKTIHITGILVQSSKSELKVGGSANLTLNITPSSAENKAVYWTVEPEAVAEVRDTNGSYVLYAKAEGTAIVTCKAKDGSGKSYSFSINVVEEKSNITYKYNDLTSGSERILKQEQYSKGSSLVEAQMYVPSNVDSSKVFAGWYTDKTLKNPVVYPLSVSSDLVLWAKWADVQQNVTLTYDLNGHGTLSESSATAKAGTSVTLPTPDANDTYTFCGWYLDAGCTDGNEVLSPYTLVTTRTIYAKWADSIVHVEGVRITSYPEKLFTGDADSLVYEVSPATASDKSVSITSSDPSVVSIENNKLVAKKAGKATITVKTNDGGKTDSCSITVSNAKVSVTGVSLNKNVASIYTGNTEKLIATVTPDNASDKSLIWESNNTAVATVSAGTVTAVKAGNAKITVTTVDGNFSAACAVTVEDIPYDVKVTGIEIASGTASVAVGATKYLSATIKPADATNKNIEWTSSDTSIATVSPAGIVTGVAKGSATITATTEDGGYKAICVVTVTESSNIILHVYNYTHIWAWNPDSTSENYTGGTWPGKAMSKEGSSSWYTYTIGKMKASIVFSNNGVGQTSDLSRTNGEWWYKDGKWTNYNPDRPVTPVVNFDTEEGTYLESFAVKITSNNASGDIIYYTTDGTNPTKSSAVYSSPVTIPVGTTVLKAFAVNAEAEVPEGQVTSAIYVVNPDADIVGPTIVANKEAGRYKEALSDINFTITDNKTAGFTVYYTTDGKQPTTASAVYTTCGAGKSSVTGKNLSLAMNQSMTVRLLAVDAAGNKSAVKSFYYACSDVNYAASRWDPRQESIYFLLTARWFDGDTSNSVGDQNCSWTEARANDNIPSGEDGFTGPEDVTWRGDFKGLVEKMDYIKSLGFTCIWLTPVVQNRSPLCYHGYHAWNMYKEDARLVSDGYDFQRVIDEAHKRDMKICLDIVINHSGRFGLEDFAEIKYNRNPAVMPTAQGWENFKYDEDKYQQAYKLLNKTGAEPSQSYPNGWHYDGLTSPGKYPAGHKIKIGSEMVDVGGQPIPPYIDVVGDVRPFTAQDLENFPALRDPSLYNYPTTESYCKTIDGVGTPGSLTLAGYASSKRRIRGHNTGFPTGSGSFDNYPDANLDSLHEDCPDLNIENPEVQDYIIGAYNRYIDMGVDMFRVDTVMHMTKETLNDHYWNAFFEEAATAKAKEARGGGDFFIFGEVANFVNNLSDKPAELRQSNYVWDNTIQGPLGDVSLNHELNGNEYRTISKAHKAVPESDYVVSCIDIVSHNGFCDGVGGAYGRALSNSSAYWDATYLTWYTDSHDYGPNKGETRWKGDFAAAWSMLFTFRGIPIVYYGSEIQFAAGKPNDWPGGGANGCNMSLEKTGRSYYGPHLEGDVTATDFGEYTASGAVETTLNSNLSKHLRDLNRIRLAVPALQMGQYSTTGHDGGWAGFKRRYTGTNKITGEAVDSYALVGVGAGTHTFTGVLAGEYVDIISGETVTASGGSVSVKAHGSSDSALVVLVKKGLATEAPGKVCKESPYLGF